MTNQKHLGDATSSQQLSLRAGLQMGLKVAAGLIAFIPAIAFLTTSSPQYRVCSEVECVGTGFACLSTSIPPTFGQLGACYDIHNGVFCGNECF